jgi:hypothetical protein
MAYPF